MMNKISEKNLRLILLLLIAVVVVAAFRFGYVPYQEKTELAEEENLLLEQELAQLNLHIAEADNYTAYLTDARANVERILDLYAAGNTPEKSIMIVRGMENRTGAYVSNASFGNDSVYFTSEALSALYKDNVTGTASQLNLAYESGYDSFKKLLKYIGEYTERMNVSAVTATFDPESGNLTGSVTVNLYEITGTGKEYVAPALSGIDIGTDNIFNTVD